MWSVLAFLSAALLGFYDSFKKTAGYRVVVWGGGLFRHVVLALVVSGPNRWLATRDGLGGSFAGVWRKTQSMAMGWCALGGLVLFDVEPKRQKGGT